MQWLSDLLPFGDNKVLQIAVLAACGIAALVVLAIAYRIIFAHRLRIPGARTRQPRLGLVDAFSLDGQRQLVIVRRDNVEHLVMIGGPNDVLIESQISRALPATRENNHVAAPAAPPPRRSEPVVAAEPPPAPQPAPQPAPAPRPIVAPQPASPSPPRQAKPQPPVVTGTIIAPVPLTPAQGQEVSAAKQPAPAMPPPAPPSPPVPAPPLSDTIGPQAPAAKLGAPLSRTGAAAKSAEPLPAPPPGVVSQGRPLPARQVMPPPIVPVSRATPITPPDKPAEPARPGAPWKLPHAAAPAPAKSASAPTTPDNKPEPAAPKDPPPVIHAGPPRAPAAATRTEAKVEQAISSPAPDPAKPVPPSHSAEDGVRPQKAADPFADLETLEAEMARLLGRDKLN